MNDYGLIEDAPFLTCQLVQRNTWWPDHAIIHVPRPHAIDNTTGTWIMVDFHCGTVSLSSVIYGFLQCGLWYDEHTPDLGWTLCTPDLDGMSSKECSFLSHCSSLGQ